MIIGYLFKIIGALGLILIVLGILNKKRKMQDIYYVFGGIFLFIYSVFIRDFVFIVLQAVFILAAIYDFEKKKFKFLKKKK